jgi:hypothetical protein
MKIVITSTTAPRDILLKIICNSEIFSIRLIVKEILHSILSMSSIKGIHHVTMKKIESTVGDPKKYENLGEPHTEMIVAGLAATPIQTDN